MESCEVSADEESLEQALTHLVQNAIDASDKDNPILVDVYKDNIFGRVDIIDKGAGMSPAFVRNGLFKPFISSKTSGFGIGAFEARELIRAMAQDKAVAGLPMPLCSPHWNAAKLAPVGSRSTAMRPTPGTSIRGATTSPPSDTARSVAASALSTRT